MFIGIVRYKTGQQFKFDAVGVGQWGVVVDERKKFFDSLKCPLY